MMSKGAQNICDLITRLDAQQHLNPEDAEVVMTLIHGAHWSGDMRALLHGIAAGILAQIARQQASPQQEQL